MPKTQNTVHLVVPVKVPEGFHMANELPDYLRKFIEIGLAKLQKDVKEDEGAFCTIGIDEDDILVATKTEWGQPSIK